MPRIQLEVQLTGQPTGYSCWITAAEMVLQYFEKINHPHVKIVKELQKKPHLFSGLVNLFTGAQGLKPENIPEFSRFYGFEQVPAIANGLWTVQMVVKLLSQYGPFFCGATYAGGFKHAITVTGADTTTSPERVFYNNPLPVGVGSKDSWTETEFQSKMAPSLGSVVLVFTSTPPLAPSDFKKIPKMILTKFT
jgi:hypothetical protein